MRAIVTVGAAGSGKSTWARNRAATEPGKYVIIERDAIRQLQGYPPVGSPEQERHVTKVQNGQIEAALLDGFVPIIADTHTNKGIRNALIRQLHKYGADVEVKVIHPSLGVVLEQNAQRGDAAVPEKVVRKMWQSLESQLEDIDGSYPVERFEPYKHNNSLDKVVIFDIDGTVADSVGVRSPYDYSKVHLDKTHDEIIEIARAMGTLYKIIFVSGRDGACRPETEAWLDKHVTEDYTLFMREAGDSRADFLVKSEIYDKDIIPFHNILAVYDDRDSVVRHIRSRGITVVQVNYGRF